MSEKESSSTGETVEKQTSPEIELVTAARVFDLLHKAQDREGVSSLPADLRRVDRLF